LLNAWNKIFWGTTDADREHEKLHYEKQEKIQKQIIADEKSRRAALVQKAEDEVREARQREAELYAQYEKTCNDLSLQQDKLAHAQASLAKASLDLERLGHEELELVSCVYSSLKAQK
jgi:hypothetical protein